MIRFVEMKGIYPDNTKSFGFYNTVNDSFLSLSDTVTFDSIKEFDELYNESCGYDHSRLKSLIPDSWYQYECLLSKDE